MHPPMSICVYCSASNHIAESYFEVARGLGEAMAARGHRLVYGGGGVGLMGTLARTVHTHGGQVLGIIPEALRPRERDDETLVQRLIVTQTMRERKRLMEAAADAFIALPGGFGTCEELLEIITLKQLNYQAKPLVILNVNGFYDLLLAFFEHATAEHFIYGDDRALFFVTSNVEAALNHIAAHRSDRPGATPPSEGELREAMEAGPADLPPRTI